MNKKTINITVVAVMTAISSIIYMLPEIPLLPGISYLKIDLSDIPAVVAAVAFGPLQGILVEIFKNAIHLLRTDTFGIGELINIGIGSAIILSLFLFSRLFSKIFNKPAISAAVYYTSSAITVLITILVGWALNAILTPVYFAVMGIPLSASAVLAGVWGSTILNAVKSAINLFPFFPVYLAIYKAVHRNAK